MSELKYKAELEALKASGYKSFNGIDLGFIKEKVTHILGLIGRNGIFGEYTKHDISHINEVLHSLDWIIPKSTADKLTHGEWLMIVLSIYFHDLGMLVTEDEYRNRYKSGFSSYKEYTLSNSEPEFINKVQKLEDQDKFLYQEFVRAKHAERIKQWILGIESNELGYCGTIISEIKPLLLNLSEKFKRDLAKICESHHRSDLDDFNKYKVELHYGSDKNEKINLHYCAIILRTADLLHITSDRTPSIEFRLINPADPISQEEWYKQMAVNNVGPKKMRDADDNIDPTIPSDTVEITAYFKGAEAAKGFFGLISYIGYAKQELKKNYEWNQRAIKQEASKYDFPWKNIDDSKIETEGFVPKLFEFNLDQNKILNLLVGHTLYNDTTVVIREIIQNATDAIRLQNFIQNGNYKNNDSKILIEWNSKDRILSFTDNGTGMSEETIEQHLLKVGSSKYQSESFKKKHPQFSPISRFGIGILTCFLIADNIDIISNSPEEENANHLSIRNVGGKYLLQHLSKDAVPQLIKENGTVIKLEVREDIYMDDIVDQINKWVIFPICDIQIIINEGEPISIGYKSPKEAIEQALQYYGYNVDGKNYKVEEDHVNGITLAYGLKYDSFFKEWHFVSIRHNDADFRRHTGTCIEGIRVEFDSPGLNDTSVLAIANASGKLAPKTNVARSNIESTNEKSSFLKSIYRLYLNHIKREINNAQNKSEFSLTWAVAEAPYILSGLINVNENIEENRETSDTQAFLHELSEVDLILIEDQNSRKLISLKNAHTIENIWTSESNLFRSAELLIKEMPGSPSFLGLIKTLNQEYFDRTIHIDTLLCGFSDFGMLQKKVLDLRYPSQIKVFTSERRVDVCWSLGDSRSWLIMDGFRSDPRYSENIKKRYYIQIADINIEGSSEIEFIQTYDAIFILSGTPIHEYITTKIHNLHPKKSATSIQVLLEYVRKTINKISPISDHDKWIDHVYDSVTERRGRLLDRTEIEKDIEKDELIDATIKTKWNTFSPSVWKRDRNYYHLYDEEDHF